MEADKKMYWRIISRSEIAKQELKKYFEEFWCLPKTEEHVVEKKAKTMIHGMLDASCNFWINKNFFSSPKLMTKAKHHNRFSREILWHGRRDEKRHSLLWCNACGLEQRYFRNFYVYGRSSKEVSRFYLFFLLYHRKQCRDYGNYFLELGTMDEKNFQLFLLLKGFY